jgi:hypothetical protein
VDKEPTTQILAVAEKIADNSKAYTELKALRRWAQAMRSYWLSPFHRAVLRPGGELHEKLSLSKPRTTGQFQNLYRIESIEAVGAGNALILVACRSNPVRRIDSNSCWQKCRG